MFMRGVRRGSGSKLAGREITRKWEKNIRDELKEDRFIESSSLTRYVDWQALLATQAFWVHIHFWRLGIHAIDIP